MDGLNAMALAIFAFESGWLKDPTVPSLRNNNPGNLRLVGRTGDAKGYTIFPDLPSGYAALLRELQSKFSGNNTHNIGPGSTLAELMAVYAPAEDANDPLSYAQFVAGYVSKAIGKPITLGSKLSEIWTPA